MLLHTGMRIGELLKVKMGDIISIIGASGVGKSTLLNLLGALDRPTEGKVLYDDQDVFQFTEKE